MAHDVYYDIVAGPSFEKILNALRWFHGVQIDSDGADTPPATAEFTITDTIGSGQPKFHFTVQMVRWASVTDPDRIEMEVAFASRPELGDWEGFYNLRTHRGRIINVEGRQSISSLECTSTGARYVIDKLISRGITTLAELTAQNEKTLWMHLVAETNCRDQQFSPKTAIYHLLHIRSSVEKIGLKLRGERHTEEELLAQLGYPMG